MSLNELVPILQLAIGPVIVISGVGLVLLSMTNRYGRVIDRARHLAEQRRAGGQGRAGRLSARIAVAGETGAVAATRDHSCVGQPVVCRADHDRSRWSISTMFA
ncbi:MAG: DUF2721 domain-containing protein [Opitutaceae bacterium]